MDDHLFYCCLVVGWNGDKTTIKFRYPDNLEIPNNIEDFCFPEVANGPLDTSRNAQCYSLAITNDKGERTFGYCRRVIPEGSTNCIPLTYCLLSKRRAPRFYKQVLKELESRHGISDYLRDELIRKFYHNKFPRPGESVKIDLTDIATGFVPATDETKKSELTLTVHYDTRYEEADLKPLHTLSSHILLKIFASLLMERKVILISCLMSKLSSCVNALPSILHPFSWPHTFIPILPESLWDFVETPTPLICGILSVSVVNDHEIDHGIVVDLDSGLVIGEEGDEDKILCNSLKKAWREDYNLASKISPNDYVQSFFLSDAYVKVFIASIKHYRNYIVNNNFEREAFIMGAKGKEIRKFLKSFTKTNIFMSFIDSVIENPERYNPLDQKIEMYGSDASQMIVSKIRRGKLNRNVSLLCVESQNKYLCTGGPK